MNDHRSQVDMPRLNVTPDEQARMTADGGAHLPAWNRERLIRQFQEIDGSSRSEAERQIDGFERSFWTARQGAPIAAGAAGRPREIDNDSAIRLSVLSCARPG
jgi:hypothetical protein